MKRYNIAERTARYDLNKLAENKLLTKQARFIFLVLPFFVWKQ
jgi:DeoR/GlpR family transcriptional regulator of sugar metabolism